MKLASKGKFLYALSGSILIVTIGLILLFAPYLNLTERIRLEKENRILMSALCLVYGAFRLYRAFAIKSNED